MGGLALVISFIAIIVALFAIAIIWSVTRDTETTANSISRLAKVVERANDRQTEINLAQAEVNLSLITDILKFTVKEKLDGGQPDATGALIIPSEVSGKIE